MAVKKLSRRQLLAGLGVSAGAALLAGCAPKVVEVTRVVKETVMVEGEAKVVEKVVKETVVQEKVVEKVVEKVATAAPEEAVNLRVHIHSGPLADWIQERGDRMHELDDKISVKVEHVPWAENKAKIRALHATGMIGDAYWTWYNAGWTLEWAQNGMSQSIDNLIAAEDYDTNVFFDSCVEACLYNGEMHGLPVQTHSSRCIALVNLQMLEEAGLEPPEVYSAWTPEDLMSYASALTVRTGDKIDRYGWINMPGYHAWMLFIRMFGGEYISEDGRTSQLETPEVIAGLKYVRDSIYEYKVAPRYDQMETSFWAMFANQKTAMTQCGSAHPPRVRMEVKGAFPWYTPLLPKGPKGDRAAVQTPAVISVTKQSKNPGAMWKFLKFLASYDSGVQKVYFGADGPGARADCYEDPKLLADFPEYDPIGAMAKVCALEPLPANYRGQQFVDTIQNTLGPIFLNEVSVEEGVAAATEAVQEVLDMPEQ